MRKKFLKVINYINTGGYAKDELLDFLDSNLFDLFHNIMKPTTMYSLSLQGIKTVKDIIDPDKLNIKKKDEIIEKNIIGLSKYDFYSIYTTRRHIYDQIKRIMQQ